MSYLPDDLWRKILRQGIKNTKLTYKDLCSISITCKRLYRLSGEDSLWSHLLSSDFPRRITFSTFFGYRLRVDPIFSVSLKEIANQLSKSQYRIRLERDRERERKQMERRRARVKLQVQRRFKVKGRRRKGFYFSSMCSCRLRS